VLHTTVLLRSSATCSVLIGAAALEPRANPPVAVHTMPTDVGASETRLCNFTRQFCSIWDRR